MLEAKHLLTRLQGFLYGPTEERSQFSSKLEPWQRVRCVFRLVLPFGALLKEPGGSSAMNFMCWVRPPAEDVDAFEKLGNEGWNWDDYLKYSKLTEWYAIMIFHGHFIELVVCIVSTQRRLSIPPCTPTRLILRIMAQRDLCTSACRITFTLSTCSSKRPAKRRV